jgi:hypothetical protein
LLLKFNFLLQQFNQLLEFLILCAQLCSVS